MQMVFFKIVYGKLILVCAMTCCLYLRIIPAARVLWSLFTSKIVLSWVQPGNPPLFAPSTHCLIGDF